MTRYSCSILLLTTLFVLTPCGPAVKSSVDLSTSETQSFPQLFRVSRQTPWLIPGASEFSTVLRTSNEQIGGALVQARIFQCSGELPIADVDFYYMRGEGQLYVRSPLLAVQNLSSYSLNGRTFAYRAAFVKVDVRSDGNREYVGAVFILYYYDEDGDGKLETRYGDLTNVKLPDWYTGK